MPLETLSIDDVLLINQRVVDDARKSDRPIAVQRGTCVDPTIKDRRLLESAIARQHAGSNGRLYYATPELNAATLMYGLAKNHAFVDGNKRTALVAMLNHLDRNHVTLGNVSWRELEEVVLDVVMGVLPDRIRLRHAAAKSPDKYDRELQALAEWIRQNSRPLKRGERRMRFDDLARLLRQFGFELAKPDGNYINVYKVSVVSRRRVFRRIVTEERQHVGTIPYPGGKREISILDIKQVRKICRLTEEFGIDSAVFYDEETAVDEIINRYRKVLRSLADK